MKLKPFFLACLVIISSLNAMENKRPRTCAIQNEHTELFVNLPMPLLQYIAQIIHHCNKDSGWRDICNVQKTCRQLHTFFIDPLLPINIMIGKTGEDTKELNRVFHVKISAHGKKSKSDRAFFNRFLITLLKIKLYPHQNPIGLALPFIKLDKKALEEFFNNLDTFDLAKRIASLDLSSCLLNALPSKFYALRNIKDLNLSDNDFPDEELTKICCLHNLQFLNLSLLCLEQLPACFSSLTNLRILDLSNNALPTAEIDKACKLKSLKELYLWENPITELPASLNMEDDFDRCSLTSLALEAYELPMNEITKVCRMTQLENLTLDAYHLPSLPDQIGNLQKLTSLTITEKELPKQEIAKICQLSKLETLAIKPTDLRSLPEQLSSLKKLKALYIWGEQTKQEENYAILLSLIPKDIQVINSRPCNPLD